MYMKSIKIKDILVAVDLDGTLLRDDKSIDQETIDAIHQYQKKGLRFTFVTSRPFEAVKKYIDMLSINIPVIVSSGAMLATKERVVYCDHIDNKLKNEVLKKFDINDVFFHCKEGLVITSKNRRHIRYKEECGIFYNPLDTYVADLANMKCCQISILNNDFIDNLWKVRELNRRYSFKYMTTSDDVIVLFNEGNDKGAGVDRLAKLLGIKSENVIVFGVDYNDLSMFERFENSVAMGNADDSIKTRAKYLTYSNEENGVIKAIEKIFKLGRD